MAYRCRNNVKSECDGCGACTKPVKVLTDLYGVPIYRGEKYYDFDCEIVSEESLSEYISKFEEIAE